MSSPTALYNMPTCSCVVRWLPVFLRLLARHGITPRVTQLTGTYSKSGGTHGGGGAIDLIIDDGRTGGRTKRAAYAVVIKLARRGGADPSWYRPKGWDNADGIEHAHVTLRRCKHRSESAVDQERAVVAGLNGLANRASDPGPRPLSGRGWARGLVWMRLQLAPKPTYVTRVVISDHLNVRAKATTRSRLVRQMRKGEKFRVVRRDPKNPNWYVTPLGNRVNASADYSRKA